MSLQTPLRAELALTSRCNLRCAYCFFFNSGNDVGKELSTEEWSAAIEELGAMKVFRLILSGGEPLMRDDLPELIEKIRRSGMRFGLLSNGCLLTTAHAAMFRDSGRCNFVQISLDGRSEEHDRMRGAGSFDRAVEAVSLLQRHGIRTHVRITVGKHNFRTLPETVRFFAEELNIRHIGCNLASRFSDKADDAETGGMLSIREELEAAVTVKKLEQRYPGVFSIRESKFTYRQTVWPYMIRAAREKLPPVNRCRPACTAQWEKIFIRADGAVTPCNHLPDTVLGYVGRDNLAELWRNADGLQNMRRPDPEAYHKFAQCRGCEYLPYCRSTAPCLTDRDRISPECLMKYRAAAPDFDFEEMQWKNGH